MTITARDAHHAFGLARNARWLETKRVDCPFEVVLSQIPPRPTDPYIKTICNGERIFARTSKGYHWLFQNAHDHLAFLRRYGHLVLASNYGTTIVGSLTEASNAMVKKAKKLKTPKKLPPGEYSGCVVDYNANASNPTFRIIPGPTVKSFRRLPYSDQMAEVNVGIRSEALQATGVVPLKTKADMMRRIAYLESRIDVNNSNHEKALNTLRLETSKEISTIYRRFAEGLLEAHMSGRRA